MLQYTWLGQPGNATENHFSSGPAPTSPDLLWQRAFTSALGANPEAFDGMLFFTQGGTIIALDPETGKTIYTILCPHLWQAEQILLPI